MFSTFGYLFLVMYQRISLLFTATIVDALQKWYFGVKIWSELWLTTWNTINLLFVNQIKEIWCASHSAIYSWSRNRHIIPSFPTTMMSTANIVFWRKDMIRTMTDYMECFKTFTSILHWRNMMFFKFCYLYFDS